MPGPRCQAGLTWSRGGAPPPGRPALPGFRTARLRAFGAISIDARQSLDQVVDEILSRTLANDGSSKHFVHALASNDGEATNPP